MTPHEDEHDDDDDDDHGDDDDDHDDDDDDDDDDCKCGATSANMWQEHCQNHYIEFLQGNLLRFWVKRGHEPECRDV